MGCRAREARDIVRSRWTSRRQTEFLQPNLTKTEFLGDPCIGTRSGPPISVNVSTWNMLPSPVECTLVAIINRSSEGCCSQVAPSRSNGAKPRVWTPLLDWWKRPMFFLTPIPRSYTSLPVDGVARNISFFLSTWIRKIMQFIMFGSIYFSYLLCPRREKTIWSELESNPGPLASQATTLTTRP